MKTHLIVIMALLWGILYTQVEMNYSYEMKYGDGKQIKPISQDTTDYTYFENLLDINTYYGDNIYVYTQLEYSNPPVFGYSRTGLDSILSAFYIEYSHNRFNLKLGDLYELYGRGLTFYTLQDQNIDYDNSIKGLNLKYLLKENLEFSILIGRGDYGYRFNAASEINDRSFINNVISSSINYEKDLLGQFQYLYLNQRSIIEGDMIEKIDGEDTEVGNDLEERDNMGLIDNMGSVETVVNHTHNINWNYFIGAFDIYIDKSWINYEKIYGQKVFGSRFYTSIYTEIFGTGLTYEYKNYYTPYLIKSISNPPIVYREGNSILASRNAHSINFGNEKGHQIDFNKNINGALNILGNLAISYRHRKEGMADLSLFDFLIMKEDSSIYDYYPFRQVYLELNGWVLSERLYYKVGLDHFTEYIYGKETYGKNTYSYTIPTQWVWKLTKSSSFTIYFEAQDRMVKKLVPIDTTPFIKKFYPNNISDKYEYKNYYLSLSFSYLGKWILTGFYETENSEKSIIYDPEKVIFYDKLTTISSAEHSWEGMDISYNLRSDTQISIFYGSQKGGLVCANGICAEQPGFEDGFKVTFRSLF